MDRSQDHFLTSLERSALQSLLRERKAAGLKIRRANALLLLDDGMAPIDIARVLYLDEETIRSWKRSFESDGLGSLDLNVYSKRDGHLTGAQEAALARLFRDRPPKTTDEVRAVIEKLFDVTYSKSGAIKLMGRLGFCYKKPKALPMGADEAAQVAHIEAYEALLNGLESDESVVFADAVHPEYQSRPAHGWFPKDEKVAIKATSGRKRLNIHGAFDLETSRLTWVESERISAETTLSLLQKLEAAYPEKRVVHVFLDNARYHHAKMLQPWLERPDCRIRLHFLPPYAPHLNPIERLWGIMHEHITHNRHYPTFGQFVDAVIGFLRNTVPKNACQWCDTITDNFRIISQKKYRVIG
jgi:transposase